MGVKFGMEEGTEAIFAVFFDVFWTSAFSGVANWQQSEKVEHGCTTTLLTFPYPTVSKSFL